MVQMQTIGRVEIEGYTYLIVEDQYFIGCSRCGGTGHYLHNGSDSICYACGNSPEGRLGNLIGDLAAAEKHAHRRALAKAARDRKREEARMVEVRKQEANAAALKAADPEVYEFLMGIVIEDDTQHLYETYEEWAQQAGSVKLERDGFIRTMAETLRWVAPSKPFTEKMIAAVRRTMERRTQAAADATPVVEGRIKITGEIVSTKISETQWGDAYRILVKDDRGFKVWGSLAKPLVDSAYDEFETWRASAGYDQYTFGSGVWFLGTNDSSTIETSGIKGRRLSFTAQVNASGTDKSFGFFSRPTKAEWIV
jgi:hypothetical protein